MSKNQWFSGNKWGFECDCGLLHCLVAETHTFQCNCGHSEQRPLCTLVKAEELGYGAWKPADPQTAEPRPSDVSATAPGSLVAFGVRMGPCPSCGSVKAICACSTGVSPMAAAQANQGAGREQLEYAYGAACPHVYRKGCTTCREDCACEASTRAVPENAHIAAIARLRKELEDLRPKIMEAPTFLAIDWADDSDQGRALKGLQECRQGNESLHDVVIRMLAEHRGCDHLDELRRLKEFSEGQARQIQALEEDLGRARNQVMFDGAIMAEQRRELEKLRRRK